MRCTGWEPYHDIRRDARAPQIQGLHHLCSSLTRLSSFSMHTRWGLPARKSRDQGNADHHSVLFHPLTWHPLLPSSIYRSWGGLSVQGPHIKSEDPTRTKYHGHVVASNDSSPTYTCLNLVGQDAPGCAGLPRLWCTPIDEAQGGNVYTACHTHVGSDGMSHVPCGSKRLLHKLWPRALRHFVTQTRKLLGMSNTTKQS